MSDIGTNHCIIVLLPDHTHSLAEHYRQDEFTSLRLKPNDSAPNDNQSAHERADDVRGGWETRPVARRGAVGRTGVRGRVAAGAGGSGGGGGTGRAGGTGGAGDRGSRCVGCYAGCAGGAACGGRVGAVEGKWGWWESRVGGWLGQGYRKHQKGMAWGARRNNNMW